MPHLHAIERIHAARSTWQETPSSPREQNTVETGDAQRRNKPSAVQAMPIDFLRTNIIWLPLELAEGRRSVAFGLTFTAFEAE
jgi:hypothetical protein